MRNAMAAMILTVSWPNFAVAQDLPTALRVDSQGRRFAGAGDDLFVHHGGQRKLLHRFPPGSTIRDVEIRGHDLYALTRSALYLFADGQGPPKKLLWGIPRGPGQQGFRRLAWGPADDLYCSFGDADPSDRWRYWTFFSQPAGTRTPFRGIGGVVRCKPDGADLRVAATGLRDPRSLGFDRYWDCYASDVDPQNTTTLVQVLPGVSFGWPRDGVPLLPALMDRDRPGRIDDAPVEPYDAVSATAAKLWQELGDPSWPRRYAAHVELQRRGGELLKQANKRILDAPLRDPALHHLIWLAARSQRGSLHLLALIADPDPRVRLQVVRALTEYPEQVHDEPIFTPLLADRDPHVQQAALLAHLTPKAGQPSPALIERGPAQSDDPVLRQTAARVLAQHATLPQIERLCERFDASLRTAGVLAAGYRLTAPAPTTPLHAQLPLANLPDESAYVIEYADGKIDLRDHGRVGTFTVAEHWKADMHSAEQESLFKLLRKMLADRDQGVRLQAARFLALLNDPRCEAEVGRVMKE